MAVALVRIKGEMMVRVPSQQMREKKSAKTPAAMILTEKGKVDAEAKGKNDAILVMQELAGQNLNNCYT